MLKTLFMTLLGSAFFYQHRLLADTPVEEMPPSDQGLWQTMTMVIMAVAFFYLIFWRPEQKRRRALAEQRAALKPGDRVTAIGIVGTIVRLDEHTAIVRMYDGSKLEFLKEAINEVIPTAEGTARSLDKDTSA